MASINQENVDKIIRNLEENGRTVDHAKALEIFRQDFEGRDFDESLVTTVCGVYTAAIWNRGCVDAIPHTHKNDLGTVTDEDGTKIKLVLADETIQPRKHLKLSAQWCRCGSDDDGMIFRKDHICSCGISKHHYHCPACGRIRQIG